MRSLAALAALGVLLSPGETLVRRDGDKVDIHASGAPLSDVLDRLSRQTGMKVLYDGVPPRPSVSVEIVGRTPVEAVLGLLEGLGLSYAVKLDPSGTRVDTLLLLSASGTSASPTRFVPPMPSRSAGEPPDEDGADDDAEPPRPTPSEVQEPPPSPTPSPSPSPLVPFLNPPNALLPPPVVSPAPPVAPPPGTLITAPQPSPAGPLVSPPRPRPSPQS